MQRVTQLSAILFFLLFAFPCFSPAATPHDETPLQVAMRLQQRYDHVSSLVLTFVQDTQGEMIGKPKHIRGIAYFLKSTGNSRMRWEYTELERQVMVSDGKQFSMYLPNLQQMVITSARTMESEPTYSFFSGTGNLIRDFEILSPDEKYSSKSENGYVPIKLIPKTEQTQVQDIHLWASNDSILHKIVIRDNFGTVTTISFDDIVIDSLMDQSPAQINAIFAFEPPKNTEIIHQ